MFAVHVTRVNDVTNVMLLITKTSFTCLSPVDLQLPIAAFIVSQTCVRLLLNGLCLQRQPYLRHNFIPTRNRAILHSVIFNSITKDYVVFSNTIIWSLKHLINTFSWVVQEIYGIKYDRLTILYSPPLITRDR